ncbi:unnamed protein product [Timema podura]|uniref:Uncharacterized protein n=1 Tax=Timema podura TaxID=61482 RepID=A0ABN7PP52_TIMPD|nr:unnamed protein product [Timema podura]
MRQTAQAAIMDWTRGGMLQQRPRVVWIPLLTPMSRSRYKRGSKKIWCSRALKRPSPPWKTKTFCRSGATRRVSLRPPANLTNLDQ